MYPAVRNCWEKNAIKKSQIKVTGISLTETERGCKNRPGALIEAEFAPSAFADRISIGG